MNTVLERNPDDVVENMEVWQMYRHSAAKIKADGLETVFPPELRPGIHKMAVCNLSGLLRALEDAFFNDELPIGPPDELEHTAIVIDILRCAIDEGRLDDFTKYVSTYI